jgi:8-oxo-dGTP pyrophosphatase MutT (NUDIX family)
MEDTRIFQDGYTKKLLVYLLRENLDGTTEVLLGMHHKQKKRNAPGGKVGDKEEFGGESVFQGAIRELREEIKVTVKEDDLVKVGNMFFSFDEGLPISCDIFVVTEWDGIPTESEELRDLHWYDITNLPVQEMWPTDLEWLPYVWEGKYFEGKLNFGKEGNNELVIEHPSNTIERLNE